MMMNDDDADAVHWQRVPDKHHAWENHENESETESVNYSDSGFYRRLVNCIVVSREMPRHTPSPMPIRIASIRPDQSPTYIVVT